MKIQKRNRKRLVCAVAAVVLSLCMLVGCSNSGSDSSSSPESADKGEKRTIVMGLDDSFPPMGFRDDNNELAGFDIDLAKAVFERMDCELVLQPINWGSKEMELENGKVDVLWNGLTITDARKETMLFTKPYLKNDQVIVTKADSGITAKAGLEGKAVGLQAGSSALEALNADEIVSKVGSVNEYETNVLAFADLKTGRIDAVVVDSVVAKYYISTEKVEFVILEESLAPEEYGIACKKDNTQLVEEIQKTLDAMNADGSAAKISEKWFGEDILLK